MKHDGTAGLRIQELSYCDADRAADAALFHALHVGAAAQRQWLDFDRENFDPDLRQGLSAAQLRAILHDYMRLAVGIAEPEGNTEFRAMCAALEDVDPVPMIRLM